MAELIYSVHTNKGAEMGEPVTTLDTRFSEPDALPATWEETRRRLADAQLFWVTTVRRDGRPHMTPLVAVWLDDALYFATGPSEQKALNLATNPYVILSTGCNNWDQGTDLVVEGEAIQVTDEQQLGRLAEAWTQKWDGRWRYTTSRGAFQHEDGGEVLVFRVVPAKILAFGKGTFSQTRHQF
jgi:nitroimidazol reductase NimA-like FMN-containing flavoprotein (pyridoxamine 5'-phosphate oxidase superfamily)